MILINFGNFSIFTNGYSWRSIISFHKLLLFWSPPKKKKKIWKFQHFLENDIISVENAKVVIVGSVFRIYLHSIPFSLSLSLSLSHLHSPPLPSPSSSFFLSFFISWEWRASSSLAINLHHLCSASLSSVVNRVAAIALSSCCHLSLSLSVSVHKTVVIIITGFVWFIWFGLVWNFFFLLLLSSGFSLFSVTLVFGGFGVRNSGELCSSRR